MFMYKSTTALLALLRSWLMKIILLGNVELSRTKPRGAEHCRKRPRPRLPEASVDCLGLSCAPASRSVSVCIGTALQLKGYNKRGKNAIINKMLTLANVLKHIRFCNYLMFVFSS